MVNKRTTRLAVGVTAAVLAAGTIGTACAQPAPRSYVASPDIYKVIAEDAQNVLILMTSNPGSAAILFRSPQGWSTASPLATYATRRRRV